MHFHTRGKLYNIMKKGISKQIWHKDCDAWSSTSITNVISVWPIVSNKYYWENIVVKFE